jgi:hypothetical protein
VWGYVPCRPPKESIEHGATVVCLRSGLDHPNEYGVLRVRVTGREALVEVCIRTDEPAVDHACTGVWQGIELAD